MRGHGHPSAADQFSRSLRIGSCSAVPGCPSQAPSVPPLALSKWDLKPHTRLRQEAPRSCGRSRLFHQVAGPPRTWPPGLGLAGQMTRTA